MHCESVLLQLFRVKLLSIHPSITQTLLPQAFKGSVAVSLPAASIRRNGAGSPLFLSGSSTVTLQQQAGVTRNSAIVGGAATVWSTAALHITEGTKVSGNTAKTKGGAVIATQSAQLVISDSDMHNNSANIGGVVYLADAVVATVIDSHLSLNQAAKFGGVFMAGGWHMARQEVTRVAGRVADMLLL